MKSSIPAVAVALTLCSLASVAVHAADWPHWRGPDRNGISKEAGWKSDFAAEGPRVLWKADVGLGYATVTVAGGRAFTTGNKDEKDTIYCLDTESGKVLWQHTYAHPKDAKYYEGGTSASPTVDGERVYSLSKRGHLICLNAADGKVLWQKQAADELKAKMPTWGFASSVLIDGNRAVVNVGTYGAAFDKTNGNLLWKTGSDDSGYSTPLPFEQGGQKLYLIFASKELAAIRADNGQKVWSHPWETSYDVNAADPVIAGPDKVFIASGYNRGGALISVAGGKPSVVWENKNIRSHFNSAILIGQHLYAIDGDVGKGQLRCVELETGKVAWTFKDTNYGAIAVADGKLIVISEKGELFIGDANPKEFKPITRAQVAGGRYWTSPVLAQGRLYLRSGEGQITCLNLGGAKVASLH
ncbi:MAG: PQQ-like beta-propeller repeat protein [Verrucomicrobiales bacterium]|nr:PQQ-like beta-propeller repeat protein [Verrucomicrobiales bacterium]